MGRILGFLAVVLVLAVAAVVALPFLIPVETYRSTIETRAKEATGRELKIKGELAFTVWPTVGIRAGDVTFANAPFADEPEMAAIKSLVVGVAVMPLLSGELEVTELVLESPKIALETDARGRVNWDFGITGTGGQPGEQGPARPGDLKDLRLGDVRISDGTVTYRNGKTRQTVTIEDIDIAVTLTSLDAPASVDGGFTYAGERFLTALTVTSPRALQKREPSALTLNASGGLFKASAEGTLDPAAGRFQGKASAEGASLRRLAAFGGAALPEVQGFGPFAVAGNLQTDGSTTRFTGATVKLDAITGTGELMVNTAGKVPALDGRLTVDQLDVNPYLAGGTGGGGAAAEGVNVEQGWSDARIDLSGLKAVDAQVQLTTGRLTFQKMTIDRAVIDLTIKGGALTATLRELALYGGSGTGKLAVDAGGRVQTVLDVAGIQAKPLLTDAVGLDNIEGQGKLAVNVAGSGQSQRAIMGSLGGTASFLFTDGAISGINLAAIARTVESALSGEAVGPAAKTDFAELAGSFKIASGVAATDDLRLLNPFIRVTGKGLVNIAQQSFDLRLEPRAVGSREGQGGAAALGGVGVPFRVTGPWTSPSFAPDLEGLVTDQLQNILGGQGGDNPLGGLIPGLGGQPAPQGQDPAPKPEEKKEPDPVGDLLRGLGGR